MDVEVNRQDIQAGLEKLQLSLSDVAQTKLMQYLDLLHKWNQTYNLTAVRNKHRMLAHHIFDSMSIVKELGNANSLLDVGSGGGMPGIPIAIARPDLTITLIDSNSKKTTFLTQVKIELSLSNVTIQQGRVEVLQEGQFDRIVSRAFSELHDFVSMTKPLLAVSGCWLAMKGTYPDAELVKLPDWVKVQEVKPINVPNITAKRHVVRMILHKEEA